MLPLSDLSDPTLWRALGCHFMGTCGVTEWCVLCRYSLACLAVLLNGLSGLPLSGQSYFVVYCALCWQFTVYPVLPLSVRCAPSCHYVVYPALSLSGVSCFAGGLSHAACPVVYVPCGLSSLVCLVRCPLYFFLFIF